MIVAGITGLFGFLAAMEALGLSASISRPIINLHNAAKAIKTGNFTISQVNRKDEIGELAQSFNDMAKSLQESFQQYEDLIERAIQGIGILQEEKFIFVNTAFLEIFGKGKEVLGNSLETIVQRENIPTGEIPTEWEVRPGQWISCQHSPILWKHIYPAILLTVQDITAQKQREAKREHERQQLLAENVRLREAMHERHSFGNIIGKSLPMQRIYEQLPDTAASQATVLLLGETGTGKGLIARTIHEHGPRKAQPFIVVNCGAIPHELFEREFFGHVKGAFTGADHNKQGYLDAAQSGTLFLDEISELPISIQVKLLHVLDQDGFSPIGSSQKKFPDIRIIAATNQHLETLLDEGKLREDFFYRINVIPITAPPLRSRKEDIPLLIDYFLELNVAKLDESSQQKSLPPELHEKFLQYSWPGNVRELKNMVSRLLTLKNLALDKKIYAFQQSFVTSSLSGSSLQESVERYERALIEIALIQTDGHRERAAELLGVPSRTFYRKLKKLGLT